MKSYFFRLGVILVIYLISPVVCFSQDFYVSTTGNDGNTGTLIQPFASIQHALAQSGPGSTIFIRGGSYHESVNLANIAGQDGSPITITSYEDEKVILDGRVKIETTWSLETANSISLPNGNNTPIENIPGIGNVYVTTLDNDIGDITQLFVDKKVMTLARYPNALAYSDDVWDHSRYLRKSSVEHGEATDLGHNGFILADTGISFVGCVGQFGSSRLVTAHNAGSSDFSHNVPIRLESGQSNYFFEGGIDNAERVMLDMAQEWAYDESTRKLTFWAENDADPNGLDIYGKNQTFAFTGDASTKYVVIDGLDFFASTFDFNSSDYITVQNCNLEYYSISERALGAETHSHTANFSGNASDFCKSVKVYNCSFEYADSSGLLADYADKLTIENCFFGHTTYIRTNEWNYEGKRRNTHAVGINFSMDVVYRRNTVSVSGANQTVALGRNYSANETEVRPIVAEYNYHTRCCLGAGDVSSMYLPEEDVWESVARYNWFINNRRRDFRWDGANIDEVKTARGNFYRNVAISNDPIRIHAFRLKGDQHEVYHNIVVGSNTSLDISVGKGGNANTISRGNSADYYTDFIQEAVEPDYFEEGGPWAAGEAYDRAKYDWGLAGDDANNYNPESVNNNSRSMRDLLRDPDNLDFRPRADAFELIDQGVPVTCTIDGVEVDVTEGYVGSAPDIGAYEFGGTEYFIGGRKLEKASIPVPPNGSTDVLIDADLMWLGALDSDFYSVYLGTSVNNLTLVGSQPNNILDIDDFDSLETYFWRVDSKLEDGSIVQGDVWSFKTENGEVWGGCDSVDGDEVSIDMEVNSIKGGANWVLNNSTDSSEYTYNNNGVNFSFRSLLYSTKSYQSDDGFILKIKYTTGDINDNLGHNFSFGLISDDTDLATYAGFNPFGEDTSIYSLGINLTEDQGSAMRGLNFTNASIAENLDDSNSFIVNESTEITLEIGKNGAWIYSINEVEEASGYISEGFDLTKSYRVAIYGQDDNGGGKSIQDISIGGCLNTLSNEAFNQSNNSLKLFPNPTASSVNIINAQNTVLRIYDTNGRILITKQLLNSEEEIDLSQLSQGIYFAKINGVEKNKTIKFLKN
ncbi:T9SS type A sorting domain-containing protein [Polaribacter sp.]|uniref:T9SS type A sorting domain-containing protein n=1 Tax=Polaribacter sp. TaxID=1920175 RepID=UPI003EF6F772